VVEIAVDEEKSLVVEEGGYFAVVDWEKIFVVEVEKSFAAFEGE